MTNHPDQAALAAMGRQFRAGDMTIEERASAAVALTLFGYRMQHLDEFEAAAAAHAQALDYLPLDVRLTGLREDPEPPSATLPVDRGPDADGDPPRGLCGAACDREGAE